MKIFAKIVAILTIVGVVAEIIVNSIPRAQSAWKNYKDNYPDEPEQKSDVDKEGFTQYTEVKEGGKNDDL